MSTRIDLVRTKKKQRLKKVFNFPDILLHAAQSPALGYVYSCICYSTAKVETHPT